MNAPTPRAAHRPSRRDAVIEAALELFAAAAPGVVTVADIAQRAGMSAAAVYYHFPSKDHLLAEGVRAFGTVLEQTLGDATRDLADGDSLAPVLSAVLDRLDDHEAGAVVFFLSSIGVSQDVEAIRLRIRTGLLDRLGAAVHQVRPSVADAEAAVVAAGLLTVLDTSATSWLERDDTYRALGRRDFRHAVGALADRVVGR